MLELVRNQCLCHYLKIHWIIDGKFPGDHLDIIRYYDTK